MARHLNFFTNCGEMKSSYIINHGLAPHFKSLLLQKIKCEPREFVQKHRINRWTSMCVSEGAEVRTRYYHSEFMGHAAADDMVTVLETATSDLDLSDLLQLSMDGPIVNWKFLDCKKTAINQCLTLVAV